MALQQKGRPPKKSQKYPQQPTDSPSNSNQPAPPKQNPDNQAQKLKAPPKQKEEPEAGKRPAPSKDGYTGGKGRMMKERHKGQFKQRGADRKMQKANPF
jgi:hypothetical protein